MKGVAYTERGKHETLQEMLQVYLLARIDVEFE
jgi:hypothetical protein